LPHGGFELIDRIERSTGVGVQIWRNDSAQRSITLIGCAESLARLRAAYHKLSCTQDIVATNDPKSRTSTIHAAGPSRGVGAIFPFEDAHMTAFIAATLERTTGLFRTVINA
jgi:hypothetical protein